MAIPRDEKKLVLRPPVRRDDLLRFTEDDPGGADEFLELLREFREDRQSRPEPTGLALSLTQTPFPDLQARLSQSELGR